MTKEQEQLISSTVQNRNGYITDVSDKIDDLIEQSNKTKDRKRKRELLEECQTLIEAFRAYCKAGGNEAKQYNDVI